MNTNVKSLTAIEQRIANQQQKLIQLKARKARLESMSRAKESKLERTNSTRRKILLGSYLLNQMEGSEEVRLEVLNKIEKWLIREDDRKLFNFS